MATSSNKTGTTSSRNEEKSSTPEATRPTPARLTRSAPDAAKIFLGKTRAQLLQTSTSAYQWNAWTMKEVRGELVSKGYLEENRGTGPVIAPQLSLLAIVALRIAATLPANAAVAADALRALAIGIELKKSEHALEAVAADVRELLSLAKDTREKEDMAGNVAEEIRAAAVQLTRTVEEQAVDIGIIATRLEEDLKRAAARVESTPHVVEQGPPTGPRSYAAAMMGTGTGRHGSRQPKQVE
ncbi:hypothetical protein B0H19DRAFT_1070006 [Mycena capillaripes]|nr:hypothetical protein B0H19DRAFT_1070006 [Mycena capillaripes]